MSLIMWSELKKLQLPMTNLIENGDFSQNKLSPPFSGTIRSSLYTDEAYIGNYCARWSEVDRDTLVLSVGGDISNAKQNDKLMVSFWYKVLSFSGSGLYSWAHEKSASEWDVFTRSLVNRTVDNKWRKITVVHTMTKDDVFRWGVRPASPTSWDILFDGFIAINLTQTFGSGNEPTVAKMDSLMSYFPNSWFDGVVNISQALSILTLNELRDIGAMITALGGTE